MVSFRSKLAGVPLTRSVYWFRNDLRIEDNPALAAALQTASELAFVFVHDVRLMEQTHVGIPRFGWHRRRFLKESLDSLHQNLRSFGHTLSEFHGYPEEILPEIIKDNKIQTLYYSKECGPEERIIENRLNILRHDFGFQIQSEWSQFLIGPEFLPYPLHELPEKFTEFRLKTEASELMKLVPLAQRSTETIKWPRPLQMRLGSEKADVLLKASVASLHSLEWSWWEPNETEKSLFDQAYKRDAPQEKIKILTGGSDAAQARLNSYFFETHAISRYFDTRNGMLNPSDSTLFSAWLSNGSISAPHIFWKVKEYEQLYSANKSTSWVIFELLWREFFKLHLLSKGADFFHPKGLQFKPTVTPADASLKSRRSNAEEEKHWRDVLSCSTSDEFINANFRELIQTGFMSNRGRQNVASFMIHELALPWTDCAGFFESLLIDYDVASNWGNWAYIAGVRFDPRGGRKFNVSKQRQDYDPDGHYVAAWTK